MINEARKMGIGRNLIVKMCHFERKHIHVKAIKLDVIDYNHTAIRFYARMGFLHILTKENHYRLFDKNYNAWALVKYNGDN